MTETSSFGTGKRESHDSSCFMSQTGLPQVEEKKDRHPQEPWPASIDQLFHKSSVHMSDVRDDSVGLMFTSPPYFAGKDFDEDMDFGDYINLLQNVFTETYRVLEPGGRAVVNIANIGRKPYIFLSDLVMRIMTEDIGFLARGEYVWVKGKGMNSSIAVGSYMSASCPCPRDLHEMILVFCKERFSRARKGVSTMTKEEFFRDTLSVWEIPPESARRVKHPAPFPVELARRVIGLWSYQDDLVLDPFMGSGTTAVAARELGRRYVGYEISREYLDNAEKRLAEI